MKTMELNGVIFEVITPRKSNVQWYNAILCSRRKGLYDCYDKPSTTKQKIYDFWIDWHFTIKGENVVPIGRLSISGANCMTFSLVGLIYIDNKDYIISITKGHNRLIKVV